MTPPETPQKFQKFQKFDPQVLEDRAAKLKAQGRMPSLEEFLKAVGEARQQVQAELKRQHSDRTE